MCAAYNKAQGAGPNDKIIIMCTVTTTSTCKSHCPASTLCMVSFIACNAPYSPYACVPNAVHCMPCFHPDSCAKLYFYQSCCMPLEPTVTWYLKPNPLQMLYQSVTRVKRSSSSCKEKLEPWQMSAVVCMEENWGCGWGVWGQEGMKLNETEKH